MEKLAELRRKLGLLNDEQSALADQLGDLIGDKKAFDAKKAEIAKIESEKSLLGEAIKAKEDAHRNSAALARPVSTTASAGASRDEDATVGHDVVSLARLAGELGSIKRGKGARVEFDDALSLVRKSTNFALDNSRHFRSFGDQLQAIASYSLSRGASCDPRLVRAPTGAGEVDPTGGGFLAQTDFASSLFILAHDLGQILGRVNKIPISANSNGLKINAVDESSRATGSRWGGVQSYWVNEGDTVTKTKPKFRRIEFDLHKLFSLAYITDELLQDSTALTGLISQAFAEEIMFLTEDAIIRGAGSGQPLGILNSPALVTVAKQGGQLTQTIVKENLDAMWSRLWGRSQNNAVWFINQLALPQLFQLNQAVGTGGQLVFLPPGGLKDSPNATLYGRPVIITEYNEAVGTPGDIILADLSQYTLVDKGGVQSATSMHIAFLTDEMAFRITYRVDGKPMWHLPITPYKGGSTLSPFIALAAR